MTAFQRCVIFAAAFAAGLLNSIAGGGTLISFPALLWLGVDPVLANATSTAALLPGSLGAVVGFRRELHGAGKDILRLGPPSVAGAIVGAFLLLHTPSKIFGAIAPYLILVATLLLGARSSVSKLIGKKSEEVGLHLPDYGGLWR
jgi:uncharacterized membrane protein YfcA